MGLFNPKVEKPKEFNLSGEELSEYSFYAMQIKARYDELEMWKQKKRMLESRIQQQRALNSTEDYDWGIDWSKVFSTQKIYAMKVPKPKVVPEKKEENEQSKLQPKQG